ncbi:MAG TPA: response regulator, partial [Anaerolineales bacterium]
TSTRGQTVKDKSGKVVRLYGTVWNITERKRTEEALRNSQARLSEAQKLARLGAWSWDVEKDVVTWSEELYDMLGMDLGQPAPTYQTLPGFYTSESWERLSQAVQVSMEQGGSYDLELDMVHPGGGIVHTSTRGQTVKDKSGKVVRLYGTVWNITERKEAEQALQASRQSLRETLASLEERVEERTRELAVARDAAEAATRAKSDFLAIMSHEIRTPLNAVIGMTSLLMDTDLTPAQQEFASTIRTSGDALLAIINDILDFSKIEAGRIELEKRAFDLHECVENAISLLLDESKQKGLELTYMIDPQVPVAILGDETRLRQILLNLLSNAIKFTDSGEIAIVVTVTDISQLSLYELHFSVRDTGLGIPQNRADKLFHSFSQVDSSTTRNYGGTGLGLAISKRLAELMGGTMWVESEGIKGKGSIFHFTAQVEKAEKPPRAFVQPVQVDLHKRRVLIVDDNASNLRILSLQTKAWGMDPHGTRIPLEALEWIRRSDPFDVALIDHQMPGMDGFMLGKEIRKLRNENDLPLVLISSIRDDSIESGLFSAQLQKPVHPSQLYDTLVHILSKTSEAVNEKINESVFDHEMGRRLPLHILLAEDHVTNQRLALLTLERLGYRADVAANGLEVLAALDRQAYDVILMDMQMPEMDGLEATRLIRGRGAGFCQPRIIAMTANVTRDDRQACLDAGMNDYLAKPIRVDELVAALNKSQPTNRNETLHKERKHPDNAPNGNVKQNASSSITLESCALDSLLKLVGGDKTGFNDLIRSFLDETPPLLNQIHEALKIKDKELLRRSAHTLKSSSRDFGAVRLSELCQRLEALGKAGNLEDAMGLIEQVETEYESVDEALKKITDGENHV